MDYATFILQQLLDAYEKSVHFRGSPRINRRIAFSFTRKNTPDYIRGETPQAKEALHQAVRELSQEGLIEVQWVPGEQNNLLQKVYLQLEAVDAAYRRAQRHPLKRTLEDIKHRLEDMRMQADTPWIRAFLADSIHTIETQAKLPPALPRARDERAFFLRALCGLDDKGDEEMLERIFSIKYLGDSKRFGRQTQRSIIKAARPFLSPEEDMTDADLLHELGIVKTTEELLLTGPLIIRLGQRRVDTGQFLHGTVIDTQLSKQLSLLSLPARTVLLVENKTNYHYLIRQGLPQHLLLIYLGGFPGPAKRRFLAMLYEMAQSTGNTRFHHWGDIDWGGISNHTLLEEKALPGLAPLFMDEATLERCKPFCETLQAPYQRRLTRMREAPRYRRFHRLLDYMLSTDLRLEQEALLADDDFCQELPGRLP